MGIFWRCKLTAKGVVLHGGYPVFTGLDRLPEFPCTGKAAQAQSDLRAALVHDFRHPDFVEDGMAQSSFSGVSVPQAPHTLTIRFPWPATLAESRRDDHLLEFEDGDIAGSDGKRCPIMVRTYYFLAKPPASDWILSLIHISEPRDRG